MKYIFFRFLNSNYHQYSIDGSPEKLIKTSEILKFVSSVIEVRNSYFVEQVGKRCNEVGSFFAVDVKNLQVLDIVREIDTGKKSVDFVDLIKILNGTRAQKTDEQRLNKPFIDKFGIKRIN